jgi:hypothetical protein
LSGNAAPAYQAQDARPGHAKKGALPWQAVTHPARRRRIASCRQHSNVQPKSSDCEDILIVLRGIVVAIVIVVAVVVVVVSAVLSSITPLLVEVVIAFAVDDVLEISG